MTIATIPAHQAGVLHAELLCEALDIHPGERVLDVAAGDGAAALAAARRWADVTAADVADAQALPFDDDVFDVVMSAFGAMFAPDQQRVADELVRVCRPAGRVGMANWAPASLVSDVSRALGPDVALHAGARPASDWGDPGRLAELFAGKVTSLRVEARQFTFRYRSPGHMLECFRSWYGPTQGLLAADLVDIYSAYNRADDGTLVAPSDYVEVVAVVR